MSLVTLYHNPNCSKSRQTKALLEKKDVTFTTIEYLKTPLSAEEIMDLASLLGVNVRNMTRSGETAYKEQELAKAGNNQLANAIAVSPILLQRPIVVKGNNARICRPPEKVLELLD